MDIRKHGQLLGDFLEVEARALRKRDVDDPVKGRFAVAAMAPARLAFGRDQAELLIVTQRRCRHGGALGHLADVDQLTGCHHWALQSMNRPADSERNAVQDVCTQWTASPQSSVARKGHRCLKLPLALS